jgi:hypothetical protein
MKRILKENIVKTKLDKINLIVLSLLIIQFTIITSTQAIGEGPSQPEAMQFEPVDVTDMVNLATGDLAYTLPLFEVPGPEGGYPIVISYHSGIGVNQEPTWVGLGWSLNPGSVNRGVNGYPDDYNGDNIQTYFTANPKSGWGIGLNLPLGPIGLNMGYDSHRGFSMNSISLNLAIPGTPIGVGISMGRTGASVSIGMYVPGTNVGLGFNSGSGGTSLSASYGANLGGGFVGSVGISAGTQGASVNAGASKGMFAGGVSGGTNGFFAGGGISYAGFSLVGFSLSSRSGGASFTTASVGMSSMTSMEGSGTLTENRASFLGMINTYTWTWTLNETYVDKSYGYLYQGEYLNSSETKKKYERQLQNGYIFTSQDNYMASAQGNSGNFMPFAAQTFKLFDLGENTEKANLLNQLNDGGPTYSTSNNMDFRFLGDQGANNATYVYNIDTNYFDGSYSNIFTTRSSGRIIEHKIQSSTGKIIGFIITETDGTIYEYLEPVYNNYLYSKSHDRVSSLVSETNMTTPYAVNWYISSIKGPDYLDKPPLGMGDEDWGYWIKFSYSDEELYQVYRSPYENYGPGASNTDIEVFSIGIREAKCLSKIETATHEARFNVQSSKNRFVPQNSKEIYFPDSYSFYSQGSYGEHTFDGNWTALIDSAIAREDSILYLQINENLEGGQSGIVYVLWDDITYYSYDPNTNRTLIKQNRWTSGPPSYINYEWLMVDNLLLEDYNTMKKLNSIELVNKKDTTKVLSKTVFKYDHKLCANTPSSKFDSTDNNYDKAKMALKEVTFYGQNNTQSMPPYKFYYAGEDNPGDLASGNPDFGADNWDRWGSYRYASTENGGNGMYKHLTPQDSTEANYATSWSLNKILTPTGGFIDIEYEADDYFYVSDLINFEYADKHLISNYTTQSPTNTCTLNGSLPETIFKGGDVFILEYLHEHRWNDDPYHSYDDHFYYEDARKINVTSIVGSTITFSPSYTFNADDFSGAEDSYDYSYYILASPKKIYGGGTRVKSIKSSDGFKEYLTRYEYTRNASDESNSEFSSGVTPSLPARYQKPFTNIIYSVDDNSVESRDNSLYKFREYYMDHKFSYGRPAPGVLYSSVTVSNISSDNTSTLNGKTVYEFFTANDFGYEVIDDNTNKILEINNYSGIYGKPKAVKYYEQVSPTSYRVIKEDRFDYGFSSKLYNHGKSLNKGYEVDLYRKPLGLIEEKYKFDNEPSGEVSRYVKRRYENLYSTKSDVAEYYFSSPSAMVPSDSTISETRNYIWDALSGQPIGSAQKVDFDETNITKVIPAYWKYDDIEDKNMLSQVYQTTLYGTTLDINNITSLKNYLFYNSNILSGSISTWSSSWGDEVDSIWRKNESYVYDRDFNFVDFPFDSLNRISDLYPNTSSLFPWYMTSNISKYDKYSHPIEESHKDGSYTSSIYGYGNALPTAIVTNAKQGEFGYVSFEDGWEDWEAGGTREEDQDDCPTGEWKVVTYQYGPTKNFFCQNDQVIDRNKTYIATAWIKLITGSAVLTIEKRNGSDTYLSRKDKYVSSSTGWELITLEIKPGDMSDLPADGYLRVWAGGDNDSSECEVDDIRFYPADASMSTYTYDPLTWKLTSITDENNITKFFKYDDVGRLIKIMDNNKKIIKRHEYNYALDN